LWDGPRSAAIRGRKRTSAAGPPGTPAAGRMVSAMVAAGRGRRFSARARQDTDRFRRGAASGPPPATRSVASSGARRSGESGSAGEVHRSRQPGQPPSRAAAGDGPRRTAVGSVGEPVLEVQADTGDVEGWPTIVRGVGRGALVARHPSRRGGRGCPARKPLLVVASAWKPSEASSFRRPDVPGVRHEQRVARCVLANGRWRPLSAWEAMARTVTRPVGSRFESRPVSAAARGVATVTGGVHEALRIARPDVALLTREDDLMIERRPPRSAGQRSDRGVCRSRR